MSEWISVKDRLPEVHQPVIIFAVGKADWLKGETTMAITDRYYPFRNVLPNSTLIEWRSPWDYFFRNYNITHWMPLPEPPKEEEEDEDE